jgi:hypothetical protein
MLIVEWLAVGANAGYIPSLQSTEKRRSLGGPHALDSQVYATRPAGDEYRFACKVALDS